MYASTKKPISWGALVLVFIVVLALGIGGYIFYSFWKEDQSTAEIEVPSPPTSPQETTQEIASPPVESSPQSNAGQEELETEDLTLLEELQTLQLTEEQFAQLQMGRGVLDDFAERFFQYESILRKDGFFEFFKTLVFDYIENRAISVKHMKESDPAFGKVHEEFVTWVIEQEDEKLVALAQFVGFYLVEELYQLPLTLLAAGLSAEMADIDFQMPVVVFGRETSPIRDGNGELKMNEQASLDSYTSAQQFLYRRGPEFSAKVLVFLEAYLAYEGY